MAGDLDDGKEHRDYTKIVWGGILIAVVLMLVVVGFSSRQRSAQSQVSVKHILVKFEGNDPAQRQRALETITDLRERILGGESFEKLASEYSDDPQSGARGGYLGWNDKGTFEKAFEEYCWNGPLNEVSPIVTTVFGYHLVVVLDRTYSEADKFDKEVEEKAKQTAPTVEVKPAADLPKAEPAPVTLPQAQPVPRAQPVPVPAAEAPAPAPEAVPAPAPAAPATP